ncbi:cytochrome d ubiquinol oxidase subunit II [Salinibacterium sp. ZJ450]|uniref:cytochrome d ubiquinol oxidase subunit II n=1 Tax=Salinibacterium sp. ZJ450 TaxID=2708338 RepID=UPI00141EAEC1|nr:cytochrome d ubiquinol oxidase subunit II [Salinibacterium sp. ZJ450]
MDLTIIWIALTIVCWVLFFVLEGFDFGVGMLSPLLGRDEHQRSAAIRTIGPLWDGNEVWLVAAIGVTFAAFPDWYAALLSGLYLPIVLVLLALAARGVAIEFRIKNESASWRRRADVALAASSAVAALGFGAVIGVMVGGLAINDGGEVMAGANALTRTIAPLMTPGAIIGALASLVSSLALGATFLALRTTGPVRERATKLAAPLLAVLAVAALAAAIALMVAGLVLQAALLAVVALLLAAGWGIVRRGREALGFTLASAATALTVVTALAAQLPVVLPSTLNDAFSITMQSAAASDYALQVISIGALCILPGVLLYQGWSYWVFRKRVASERVAS